MEKTNNYEIVEQEIYDYYINVINYPIHYNKIKHEESKENKGNLGKYLLFNFNREELIEEALLIADTFNLSLFRISKVNSNNGMYSYVASIYDYENRYSINIRKFFESNYLNSYFRLWKSQHKSDRGIYSIQYLKSITKNLTNG